MATADLDEALRVEGVSALVSFVLQSDPRTAPVAKTNRISATQAVDRLTRALRHDPSGWAAWLNEPAHENFAASISRVLSQPEFRELRHDERLSDLNAVVDEQTETRANVKALAAEYARDRVSETLIDDDSAQVIDLRDRIKTH
jgi:hypothetical protein